ncbi:MAG TPA: AMP-binding protein [Steroidobacteraceae bacterium]|nr:AMP-binding protein [Steroidobacteraceae bacterium]
MSQENWTDDGERLIWDHWRRHADAAPDAEAIVHVSLDGPTRRWKWGELMRSASQISRRLRDGGVRRGEVCAVIIRHHPSFYPVYLGICGAGALPAVLAYPSARLHPEKFREGLHGMSQRSGLDHILTEHDLTDTLLPLVGGDGSTIRDLLYPLDWLESGGTDGGIDDHPPAAPSDPCLLQHSSGTTGLQKPVVLSHAAVLRHLRRYARAIRLRDDDRIVSWLPLYHDMGLIAAFYLALVQRVPLVQLSPIEWVSFPALLLRQISAERGTLCWLPNFALSLMADRVRDDDLEGVRLDSLRMLINCSEPVRAESQEKFHHRFGRIGLRREALAACYAMAETTFAVTQTAPGREPAVLTVDRGQLAKGNVVAPADPASARVCVSSGTTIEGCKVRIVDEQRGDLPPDRLGEIAIASASMFDGYRNYPEKTAQVLADGWYYSGDLGFIHDGQCFVLGRKKDVIIVAGNNVYPEDVEDAVGKVAGVVPGRVVAFAADDSANGTESIAVIAETAIDETPARKALRTAILTAAMAIDVTVSRLYLVPPRWMIKSSSGKPARAANRSRVTDEMARG